MSYNISTWTVKRLDDLVIPVKLLYEGSDYFDKPALDLETNTVRLSGMDGTCIVGRLEGTQLHVTEIKCYGEGSGSTYHNVLLPALKQSTGALVVVCVWEGGEDITRLVVKEGVVEEQDIEL